MGRGGLTFIQQRRGTTLSRVKWSEGKGEGGERRGRLVTSIRMPELYQDGGEGLSTGGCLVAGRRGPQMSTDHGTLRGKGGLDTTDSWS